MKAQSEIARWLITTILVAQISVASRSNASTSSQLPQFHHTNWGEESGLGAVYDIQQAMDGYLWLQTATGIFRFDGVSFQPVDEVTHGMVHNSALDAVLPASSGGVWFMTRNAGLLLWKDEHLASFPDIRCTGRLREAPDGSLWVAGSSGLFHLEGTVCREIGPENGYPGGVPAGILVDREGTVWVKTWQGNLLFLPHGQSRFQISPTGGGATATLAFLHEAPNGSIWLSDGHGLREVRGAIGAPVMFRAPGPEHEKTALFGDFAFAADGSIWIVTNRGVRWSDHLEQWQTPKEMQSSAGESWSIEQGLTSDVVWAVLVDHEGSVWLATNSGLDQIRRTAFRALLLPHAQEHEFAVAAGDGGSVWTGSESLDLTHVASNGVITGFPKIGQITCLKRDRTGTLWVASKGPNHLWRSSDTGFIEMRYPDDEFQPIVSIAIGRDNGLFISLRQYGVFRLLDGIWSNQNDEIGKPVNIIGAMTDDDEGNAWLAFSNKLVKWDGVHYSKFSAPSSSASLFNTTMAARNGHVWLPGPAGVTLFSQDHFRLLRFKDETLPGPVSGIVETSGGDLWINGFSGVTHVSAGELAKWRRDPAYSVAAERFDALDGLPGKSGETVPTPSLVESKEGRLWFATTKGVAWIDPAALDESRNRLPPPVVISSIISDGRPYAGLHDFALPPHPRSVEIDYTALSLAVPQRVLFRYKLEGLDKEWHNAGIRREAFYNSLQPGHYLFRVIACNNNGVWNETGTSTSFVVTPAFYQTWWFLALTIIACAGAVWLIFCIRLRIIMHELQGRLAERLEERERIARELHDTLLQGMFGLTLRLQSSVDRLEVGNSVRADITQALNQSDAMMLQGRERIRNLRISHSDPTSLVAAFETHGRQLQDISSAQFHVSLVGEARPLNPIIQEEVVLIGREALTNAFRHSGASVIAVEISYRWNTLHVRVHDNGRGLEESLLRQGARKDHWGLPNMRDRAKKMHAELRVELRAEGGTQIDLRVPGAVVYKTDGAAKNRVWLLFPRSLRKNE
jgi:signal transduction histidine kinase/ligand-binding sensor domain-containing protein